MSLKQRALSMSWLLAVTACAWGQKGPLSVTDAGAVGDGKTDATAAFQKAVDTARDVYVPPGRYFVKTLKLPDQTYFHGAGSASVLVLGKGSGMLNLGNGCRVTNLSFTGEEPYTTAHEDALGQAILNVGASRGVTIDNVQIENYRNTGIVTDHATDVRISGCHFEKLNSAVQIQFSQRIWVTGNRAIDIGRHAFQHWGNWKFETKVGEDLIFANNYVKNGGGGPIWGTGARRVIYANNIVDGADDIGLDLEWSEDCTVTGNTVRNCENAGIALFFSCKRVSITGNTILNDRPIKDPKADWWARSGIWLTYPNKGTFKNDTGHRDVTIVGNTIACTEGQRRAIWIGSESDNVTIANNTLSGGDVWYGGQHNVNPLELIKIQNNSFVHKGKVVGK